MCRKKEKMQNDSHFRFPIGEAPFPEKLDLNEIKQNIQEIAALPIHLGQVIKSTTIQQLKNQYREHGWSGLQVMHHLADSHINAYCRMKLALTEINPTIKPYEEQKWAELPDYDESLLNTTLVLVEALHKKWTYLMNTLSEEQWRRTFYHPESQKQTALFQQVAIYAWHGKHHLQHIKIAISK
jgi:hypothetical protein